MILVLGATGSTGREVARQLIASGVRPRLLVRNRAKAREFDGKAEIVEGDMSAGSSLASALKDAEKLYLVSSGLEGFALENKVIDAAKNAGVRHVVKLSAIGADQPVLTFSQWHANVERHLMDSGMGWTMLRPGSFMTNTSLFWADTIKSQGKIYHPTGNGRWPSIDPADIAAVAVKALTQPGHDGQGYTLTGVESLSAAEYAEKFSQVLGRSITFVDVPAEAAKEGMLKTGMPEEYADALLNLLGAIRAGHGDIVTNTFEELMGHKPATFEDWLRRNISAFQ
jgi:uncharacterized protein YbjT (DUF2867 family)